MELPKLCVFHFAWHYRACVHKEQLERYRRKREERITIGDVTKSRYEWSQEQRRIETAIRQQKNVANLAKASGDDALRRHAQAQINDLDAAYAKVSQAAGLIPQRERMGVAGFAKVKTIEELKGTPKYATLKTEQNQAWLQKGYDAAVKKGDISALTGFEQYMKVAESVERELVGQITNDGIEITGYKTHFIDRIIGSYEQKREPVNITDAMIAIRNPEDTINSLRGSKSSRQYRGPRCWVTVNPDTGELIQTTSKKKG